MRAAHIISTNPLLTSEAGNKGKAKIYFSQSPMLKLLSKYYFKNKVVFSIFYTSSDLNETCVICRSSKIDMSISYL